MTLGKFTVFTVRLRHLDDGIIQSGLQLGIHYKHVVNDFSYVGYVAAVLAVILIVGCSPSDQRGAQRTCPSRPPPALIPGMTPRSRPSGRFEGHAAPSICQAGAGEAAGHLRRSTTWQGLTPAIR